MTTPLAILTASPDRLIRQKEEDYEVLDHLRLYGARWLMLSFHEDPKEWCNVADVETSIEFQIAKGRGLI